MHNGGRRARDRPPHRVSIPDKGGSDARIMACQPAATGTIFFPITTKVTIWKHEREKEAKKAN